MASNNTNIESGKAGTVAHTEYNGTGEYVPNVDLVEAAVATGEEEASRGRKALFGMYKPAVIYSCLLSLALVMEGMDVGLINNFFTHPAYVKKFGWPGPDGKNYISANWQTGIGLANNGGSILGLLLNGYLQSRFGSRRVYMFAMALMACTIFILFFATSVEMLLVGNLVCGIPWGIFQTLTTAYAAEICPASIRGYLTAWVSMCWGAGSFLATGVLRGSISLGEGDIAWKVPYALQWVWIPPLFLVAYFCPESPWYLIRRGRDEDAEKALRRLAAKGHYTDETMRQTIALMKHTNEMERLEAENASYKDCFTGTNLRRTGIVCMAWVIQILNGQSITNYATIMLQAVGMTDATDRFNYNMGIQSVNIFATAIAIALMGNIGRRTFYFYGSSGIGLCMLVIGALGFASITNKQRGIPVAVFLIIVQCIFKVSLGPTTYVVVGEVASNRVRAQTIVLGRAVYVCGQMIVTVLNPRFLNTTPGSWGLGAKTGIFYFCLCFVWAVWIFFFLPETMNRTFADIDYLFKKKTPARKFTTTPVDLFEFNPPQEKLRYDDDAPAPVEVEEKRA